MDRFSHWHGMLQNSRTVRSVMRKYAETFAAVRNVLPNDVQEALASEDIQAAAVISLQAEIRDQGSSELGKLLHEIAHVYAAAAVRLAKINREPLAPAP